MAELSDQDKRAMLGENYKEIKSQMLGAAGLSDAEQVLKDRQSKYANYRLGSVVIVAVALVIAISNYMAVSGPYNGITEWLAVGAVALGGIGAVCSHMIVRKAELG